MSVDVKRLLTGVSTFINVIIKIYTKTTSLHGDKASAKEVSEIQEGYIYVFRVYPRGQENKDGTRTSVYKAVDISREKNVNVLTNDDGVARRYFFAFSRIALPDIRLEMMRKSLHEFICDPSSKQYRRVQYIPLFPGVENIQREYLCGDPEDRDVDFGATTISTEHYKPTVYLHDWYGYLETAVDQYEKGWNALDSYFKEKFDLTVYSSINDQSIKNIKRDAYRKNDIKPYNYEIMKDTSGKSMDCFSRYDLYAFTSILIEKLSKVNKKMHPSDDLRIHYEQDQENLIDDRAVEMVSWQNTKILRRYDYYAFYLETKAREAELKKDVYPHIKTIVALYTDQYRRMHQELYDYMYISDKDRQHKASDLLGKSMEGICLFIKDEPSLKQEYEALRKVIEEAFDPAFKKIPGDCNNIRVYYEETGDRNIFECYFGFTEWELTTTSLEYVIKAVVQVLFDKPELVLEVITNGRFKEVAGVGKVVAIRTSDINAWLKRHNITSHPDLDSKLALWDDFYKPKLKKGKVHFVTENGIHFAKYEKMINPKFNRLRNVFEDKVTKFEKVSLAFDAINVMIQIKAIADGNNTWADIFASISSIGGSIASIAEVLLAGKGSASKIAGGSAIVLLSFEYLFQTVKYDHLNDDDTKQLYVEAVFLNATLALPLYFASPLAGGIASLAIAIMTTIGSARTLDDNIDIFLKYSIWGSHYRDKWGKTGDNLKNTRLPSWWPLGEDITEIVLGPDLVNSENTKKLYDDNSSNTLKLNQDLFNLLLQIPDYELKFLSDELLQYLPHKVAYAQKAGGLNKIDFTEVKAISVDIRKKKENISLLQNEIYLVPDKLMPYLVDNEDKSATRLEDAVKFKCIFIEEQLRNMAANNTYIPQNLKAVFEQEKARFVYVKDMPVLSKKRVRIRFEFNDGRLPVRLEGDFYI